MSKTPFALTAVAGLTMLAACGQPASEPAEATPPPAEPVAAPAAPEGDALVPGTNFNATGDVACAAAASQPMGRCAAGVVRNADGTATVTITRADGRTRAIFFQNGTAIGSDASQADGADAMSGFTATKDNDLFKIAVGTAERYEIPEALVIGG